MTRAHTPSCRLRHIRPDPLAHALNNAFHPFYEAPMREQADAIEKGMQRIERKKKTEIIAKPMRALFQVLLGGEVDEIDGKVVMQMPDYDYRFAEKAEWVEVPPAISGWIDCWKRLAPEISTYHMQVLSRSLDEGKAITPRLVEKARDEFEATVSRLPDMPTETLISAITTTQIAWEFEKMEKAA